MGLKGKEAVGMDLCLGTVQFGMEYGVQGNGRPGYPQVRRMLDMARREGVAYLDTASVYGEAEAILGRYLSERPGAGDAFRIVSKLRPGAFDGASDRKGRVLEEIRASLDRLHVSRLHAYLFHDAAQVFDPLAVDALHAAEEEGLAGRVGASVYTPEEAMRALSCPQIRAVQIPYNVFDRRLDDAGFFERAAERDVQVFARSSLLQGLAVMDPDALPEKVRFARPWLRRFRDLCGAYGISPLRGAVGYVMARPGIHAVVLGADDEAQLGEYLSLRDAVLPPSLMGELRDAFARGVEEKLVVPMLWGT